VHQHRFLSSSVCCSLKLPQRSHTWIKAIPGGRWSWARREGLPPSRSIPLPPDVGETNRLTTSHRSSSRMTAATDSRLRRRVPDSGPSCGRLRPGLTIADGCVIQEGKRTTWSTPPAAACCALPELWPPAVSHNVASFPAWPGRTTSTEESLFYPRSCERGYYGQIQGQM
jgi:hypothetical protein